MRKIKADYIPKTITKLATKGDFHGLMRERKAIWHRIHGMIGIQAMEGLGLNGNTNILTLLKTEKMLLEDNAKRHALALLKDA